MTMPDLLLPQILSMRTVAHMNACFCVSLDQYIFHGRGKGRRRTAIPYSGLPFLRSWISSICAVDDAACVQIAREGSEMEGWLCRVGMKLRCTTIRVQ